eukprot:5596040-Amphidinium_carterae.1
MQPTGCPTKGAARDQSKTASSLVGKDSLVMNCLLDSSSGQHDVAPLPHDETLLVRGLSACFSQGRQFHATWVMITRTP